MTKKIFIVRRGLTVNKEIKKMIKLVRNCDIVSRVNAGYSIIQMKGLMILTMMYGR